ncbi:MAG TPA: 3-isopropylmalate dehydratase small subunit [Gaiellaceae bacterium]|nr:3-isopropylmalate dehydratase small subunit [Gaiellaceae bacterium]
MKAFRSLTARAAVLDRPDVDTDQIIPKQFLKRIERTGYGDFLFYDWRQDPDFELNRPGCGGARILVTGPNFGCGSSREHAAWALSDYGFDVVVAPSFGDIFFSNAVQIGLVPVTLPSDEVKALTAAVGDGADVTVDLDAQTIDHPAGRVIAFEIDPFVRMCLLNGLDSIARTLQHESDIEAFEERSPSPVTTTAL